MAAMAAATDEMRGALDQVDELRAAVAGDVAEYEKAKGAGLLEDTACDVRLARWLIAYDNKVAEAADAFRAMLKWRLEDKVDELRENALEGRELRQRSLPHWERVREMGEFGPWYAAGRCHEGDLVHLEVMGRTPPSKLLQGVSEDQILEHQVGFFEVRSLLLDELSRAEARLVRTVQVRDLSHLSVMDMLQNPNARRVVSEVMKKGTKFFPESTRKVIFINTPSAFSSVFAMFSGILRRKTVEKVMFLGSDYHRELLHYVDARSVHRLEKMSRLEDNQFIEKGDAEDHLPLAIQHQLSVPAGGSAYFAVWMAREGPRSKLHIKVSHDAAAVPLSLRFAASYRASAVKSQVVVEDLELDLATLEREAGGALVVPFPAALSPEISSGFVFVTLDNSQAWVQSASVPIAVTVAGDKA